MKGPNRGRFVPKARLATPSLTCRTAGCGPACPVMREGRTGDCPPIPIPRLPLWTSTATPSLYIATKGVRNRGGVCAELAPAKFRLTFGEDARIGAAVDAQPDGSRSLATRAPQS